MCVAKSVDIRSYVHHKPNTQMIQVHARRETQSVFRCPFYVEVVIRERLSKLCLVHYSNTTNVAKNQHS